MHVGCPVVREIRCDSAAKRTVDGNGDALGERVAILAEEGRDLAERAGLEVLRRGLGGIGGDALEVDAVGLRDHRNGGAAGVVLCGERVSDDAISIERAARIFWGIVA